MPNSKTVSTCAPRREQGTHVFHILGYSQHMAARDGTQFIMSDRFSVGGYDWRVVFCSDWKESGSNEDYVAAAVQLMRNTRVQASFELKLLSQGAGPSLSLLKEKSEVFGPKDEDTMRSVIIKRKLFEETTYLQDDRLALECTVTVFRPPRPTQTRSFPRIQVPPSDIGNHFGKLLETKEGSDVTFSVGGVNFTAHKMVLATRSPVFRAELYGPMRERGTKPIVVEDIQPDVFMALMNFIYNDSLRHLDDLEADNYDEMIRHLLVAADRYAMERLKLMCQSILCERLHVKTVATTLGLADQHNCDMLKDACIEFISCSNAMDVVAATQGYKSLKRSCPSVVIEALEKTSRIHNA